MAGRIDCYVDIASFYSFVAFVKLQEVQPLLKAHSIELEFHPVLLGAINNATGNQPPSTLPAKAFHSRYDIARAKQSINRLKANPPTDLMNSGRTMVPNRALHYIKDNYPVSTFETALAWIFHLHYEQGRNVNQAEDLQAALAVVPSTFTGIGTGVQAEPLFTIADVEKIMKGAASTQYKNRLKDATQQALDRGAFGAPWLWVTNRSGEAEPFFGSDRFHYVWEYLGLPYQDVTLLSPGEKPRAPSKL